MASYRRRAVYSRRLRQPSLWNSLMFRLSLLAPFNPMSEFPMSTSRRNVIIRTVAGISGDIAIGIAVASACIWFIEVAALGVFLSFLLWLLGALIALAISQYVVHPAVAVLLSNRKLDVGIDALTGLAEQARRVGTQTAQQFWRRFMPSAQR